MQIIARDVMTSPVATVPPTMRTTAVARLLAERGYSAVPVVNEAGKVLGVVSEADLLHQVSGVVDEQPGFLARLFADRDQMAARWARLHGTTAADVMTPDPISVSTTAPLSEIVTKLEKAHVRRVLVTDNGRLVGVVSRADLLRMVVPAHAADSTGTQDEDIRRALHAELRRQPWAWIETLTCDVHDGVVTYSGWVNGAGTKKALDVLARGIPGVRDVKDETIETPMGMTVYGP